MDVIDSLMAWVSKGKDNKETPEGYCPNCWGKEEYSGRFYEAVHKHANDRGWIQDYAAKKLHSIKLEKKATDYECPGCKLSYRESK